MSIADRRRQAARLRAKRQFHWGRDLRGEPKHLAKAVNTPKPCSCAACGNKRRICGATMQERKAFASMRAEPWA